MLFAFMVLNSYILNVVIFNYNYYTYLLEILIIQSISVLLMLHSNCQKAGMKEIQ